MIQNGKYQTVKLGCKKFQLLYIFTNVNNHFEARLK